MTGSDRALAYRIYREVQVWRSRLDASLERFSDRPLHALEVDLLALLRIGAAQMLLLGVPAYAAVSTTVDASPSRRYRGYLNAVLRGMARKGMAERPLPDHLYYSHPRRLVERWRTRYGSEDTLRLLEWNNSIPDLGGFDFSGSSRQGRYLESYRSLERDGQREIGIDSRLYIQDEASAVVGRGMAALPGNPVLEIGAAPGGKTAHLDTSADLLIAVDSSMSRLRMWMENSSRLCWHNSHPVAALAPHMPFSELFGRVIVDAPCTNTGVYRRRTDARYGWSESYLREMVAVQRALLGCGAGFVAPGGTLIYSTCSLEPEENTGQVKWFETKFEDYHRMPFPAPPELVTDGMVDIFPPEARIDGLFAAAWKRAQ